MLISFKVYCDDMEQAIEKTVAYAEANGYNGLLLDVGEMNERAKEDLAYEKATETLSDDDRAKMSYDDIVNAGMPIVDKMEDEDTDTFYDNIDRFLDDLIYIDATMEGAKQCYYIYGEVQAEEFDDSKIEESVKSNYAKGKDYLENIAKSNNEKYYEIVEDTYEYPNGLMLITYNDEAHEDEKDHICIDLDNLQNLTEANDRFADMVRELHSYVEADPAKISQDLKQALKSNTIDTYLSSKAGMTDDEINIFKNKYLSVDEKL